MIKVIKHGKTKFTATCSRCGCEFEYELKDLDISGKVKCPDCDQDYYHPGQTLTYPSYPNLPNIYPSWDPNVIKTPSTDPCEGCSFYQRLKKGVPYIGDSPCEWCQHNKWKITWTTGVGEVKTGDPYIDLKGGIAGSTTFVTGDSKDVSK